MDGLEEVPAAESKVAVGIATKLGIIGTVILTACSVATTVLAGYHGKDTRTLATLATVVATATIIGRMAQAIAKELSSGRSAALSYSRIGEALSTGVDEIKDVVEEPPPTERPVVKPVRKPVRNRTPRKQKP